MSRGIFPRAIHPYLVAQHLSRVARPYGRGIWTAIYRPSSRRSVTPVDRRTRGIPADRRVPRVRVAKAAWYWNTQRRCSAGRNKDIGIGYSMLPVIVALPICQPVKSIGIYFVLLITAVGLGAAFGVNSVTAQAVKTPRFVQTTSECSRRRAAQRTPIR
jgi:hypothetical protein